MVTRKQLEDMMNRIKSKDEELKKLQDTNKKMVTEMTKKVDEVARSEQESQLHKEREHKARKEVTKKEEELKILKKKNDTMAEEMKKSDTNMFSLRQNEEKMKEKDDEIRRVTQKMTESNENCSDMLFELRIKRKELEDKDNELKLLERKLNSVEATLKRQEENLEEQRDMNVRSKNQMKLLKQNYETQSPSSDYIDFKETVSRNFGELFEAIKELKKNASSKNTAQEGRRLENHQNESQSQKAQRNLEERNRNEKSKKTINRRDSNMRHTDLDSDIYPSTQNIGREKKNDLGARSGNSGLNANTTSNNDSNVESSNRSSRDQDYVEDSRSQPPQRIVPGEHLYSEVTHVRDPRNNRENNGTTPPKEAIKDKKTLIFSTSITKHFDEGLFDAAYVHGFAQFQRWPGGTAEFIKHYVEPHLQREKPDTVVIQIGGNDMHRADKNDPATITAIANDIIDTALVCRANGVRHIFVGGVAVRRPKWMWNIIKDLNGALEGLCELYNLTFYSNSDITTRDLYDGTHLNGNGVHKMASNMVDSLNYYFWNLLKSN